MPGKTRHGRCASRMTSFNEIPDYLRSDDRDTWTQEQGLFRGAAAVFIAAVIIGTVLYWITFRLPGFTMNGLLSFATTFLLTWVLFSIMHRVSGVIHPVGTAIVVVAMVAVVLAKYVACLAYEADVSLEADSVWGTMQWETLIFGNSSAWLALACAGFACRKGVSFEDMVGFIGRR